MGQERRREALDAHGEQDREEHQPLEGPGPGDAGGLEFDGEQTRHRRRHDAAGGDPAEHQLVAPAQGGQAQATGLDHQPAVEHQGQHAGHPAPAQGAEFAPRQIRRQQREQHRDGQLGQLADQLIELAGLRVEPQAHHHASTHGGGEAGLRQQRLGAAHQHKQHPQAELQLEGIGIRRQAPQHLHQHPAPERADHHATAQPHRQQPGHVVPAGQIPQGQLQQQQGQHRTGRLQDQTLGLQHLAQARQQAHLLHHRRHHRGAGGQGNGAEHPGQGPGQAGQLMGQPGTTHQPQHPAHQHQLHHGALQVAAGEAQVEAAIEQHQAHQ